MPMCALCLVPRIGYYKLFFSKKNDKALNALGRNKILNDLGSHNLNNVPGVLAIIQYVQDNAS